MQVFVEQSLKVIICNWNNAPVDYIMTETVILCTPGHIACSVNQHVHFSANKCSHYWVYLLCFAPHSLRTMPLFSKDFNKAIINLKVNIANLVPIRKRYNNRIDNYAFNYLCALNFTLILYLKGLKLFCLCQNVRNKI